MAFNILFPTEAAEVGAAEYDLLCNYYSNILAINILRKFYLTVVFQILRRFFAFTTDIKIPAGLLRGE